MLFAELQNKIEQAPELDFGTILNESIELFKKVWVQGLLMTLITLACTIPIMAILWVPMMFLGLADASNPEQFENLEPLAVIVLGFAYFIATFLMAIVGFAIKASFYRIVKNKDLNLVDKEDYFFFLKKPYLLKSVKIAFISFLIAIGAVLLCVLPLIYAIVPLSLINVVYAFNPNLSASNIIKASFELGNKKWLITFGLLIVAGLLAQILGFLLCCVGIFVTSAFTMLPLYVIYKKVVGFESTEVDEIGIQSF